MRIQRCIAYAVVVGLVSLLAGSALGDDNSNALLTGKYRLTGNKNCASVSNTEPPFTPTPLPTESGNFLIFAGGVGSAPNLYFTGVNIFDGRGHITTRERGTAILLATQQAQYSQGDLAIAVFEETCEWTYRVNRNGKYTAAGSCEATDHSYKVSGFKLEGQVDDRGSVVSYGQVIPPVLETLEFLDANGTVVSTDRRLCGGTGTMVRIPE
ncbi:MAG: hypothetical protein ACT4O4_05945 [Nitrospiraceae bacterium]